jgi:hypothetical protein
LIEGVSLVQIRSSLSFVQVFCLLFSPQRKTVRMTESDPEDEICVMELIKRRKAAAATLHKTEGSSGKNATKSSSNGNQKRKRKNSDDSSEESSSESSDDDDRPIGELLKKKKQATNKELNAKKSAEDKPAPKKKAVSSSGGDDKVSKRSRSAQAQKSTEYYNDTDKGKLVQRLLLRWWYAIEWPKPEDINDPPPGYEPLEGFAGVFICTRVRKTILFISFYNDKTHFSFSSLSFQLFLSYSYRVMLWATFWTYERKRTALLSRISLSGPVLRLKPLVSLPMRNKWKSCRRWKRKRRLCIETCDRN